MIKYRHVPSYLESEGADMNENLLLLPTNEYKFLQMLIDMQLVSSHINETELGRTVFFLATIFKTAVAETSTNNYLLYF